MKRSVYTEATREAAMEMIAERCLLVFVPTVMFICFVYACLARLPQRR